MFNIYSQDLPMTMAGFGGLGMGELIVVLVIVMVVFGAGKIPAVGSSLGEAIKNFKKSMNDGDNESKIEVKKELSKHEDTHQ